jgi:D-alanyl-D-alanine carboxypeptidase
MKKSRLKGMGQRELVNKDVVDIIFSAVMNYYEVTEEQMCSKSKKKDYTEPRHIVCSLIYSFTQNNQSVIGERMGGRDHATINHSMKNVVNWYELDKPFRDIVNKIIAYINFESKHTYTFQQVIDVKLGVRGVKYERDTLVESFNTKVTGLMYTEDTHAILDIVKQLKLINGEIWSKGVQTEFKLKQDAKKSQSN